MVLERFDLTDNLIDIAFPARSKSCRRQAGEFTDCVLFTVEWLLAAGLRGPRSESPRLLRWLGFAGAAFADPALSPGPGLADPSPQTPASGGPLPPSLANLLGPAPLAFPQLGEPQFRADASTPSKPAAGSWGALSGDWQNQSLLGDMGGLRPALANYGVTLGILENFECSAISPAASSRVFEPKGLTTVTLQMDTEKAFGLKGGTLNVERPPSLWRPTERGRSPGPADPERHRRARGRSALGAVVSAEIRRQVRRQDRRAEPRRGIHYRPERELPLR